MSKLIHKVINNASTQYGNQFNIELIISSIFNCKYILILIIYKLVEKRQFSTLWITGLKNSLTRVKRSIPLSRNFRRFKGLCFPSARPPITRRPCRNLKYYIARLFSATATRWDRGVFNVWGRFQICIGGLQI